MIAFKIHRWFLSNQVVHASQLGEQLETKHLHCSHFAFKLKWTHFLISFFVSSHLSLAQYHLRSACSPSAGFDQAFDFSLGECLYTWACKSLQNFHWQAVEKSCIYHCYFQGIFIMYFCTNELKVSKNTYSSGWSKTFATLSKNRTAYKEIKIKMCHQQKNNLHGKNYVCFDFCKL